MMPFFVEILELATAGLLLATAMPLFKKIVYFCGSTIPLAGIVQVQQPSNLHNAEAK